jgi:hypothetical protein
MIGVRQVKRFATERTTPRKKRVHGAELVRAEVMFLCRACVATQEVVSASELRISHPCFSFSSVVA